MVIISCGQHRKGKKDSTKSCPTLAIPRTVACQALLFIGFSRQEYWSGLPFSSPGELPTEELNPGLPYCGHMLSWLSYAGRHKLFTKSNRKHRKRSRDITEVLILIYVLTFGFCQTKLCLYNVFSDLLHFQLFPLKLVFVAWSKKGIINGRTLFSDSS